MSIFKRKKEKKKQAEVTRVLKRGCLDCKNAQYGQIGDYYITCWCPIDEDFVISMDEAVVVASELAVCPHFKKLKRQKEETLF